MRILLIEDDPRIADYIEKGLREAGYTVVATRDGREGLFLATGEDVDAIILDRMLPGLDGLDVLRMLRTAGRATPVIILSSLADVQQRVEGLREGADDYLVKPFAFAELQARLEALLRRPANTPREQTQLVVADLEMDLLRRTVTRAGQPVDLQPREFRLLEYLMRHPDQVVTRTMLLEAVWDYHFDPQTNVIDVHISRLRQKIDRDHEQPLLHTVRGAGYRLGLS
ncbi:MAG TPA: response regulator transcription factor [Moraxellaceae bacterium]|nr:response regulator transcription factor [Moraxellaceae bacterium]